MMNRETVLFPGTYKFEPNPRHRPSIERIVRQVMRDAGYPVVHCDDAPCVQPDLCDLLVAAGCVGEGADGVVVSGSLSGNTLTLVRSIGGPVTIDLSALNENLAVTDSATIDFTLTGTGTSGSPFTITGVVKLDSAEGNLLNEAAGGLRLDCGDLDNCGFLNGESAENGLSVVVDTPNKIHLGGPLIEDTNIDGDNLYDLTLTDLDNFQVIVDGGGSAKSYLQLFKAVSTPIVVRQEVVATPANFAQLQLDADGSNTRLTQETAANQAGVFMTSASSADIRAIQGAANTKAEVIPTAFTAKVVNAGTIYSQVYAAIDGAHLRNFNSANSANAQVLAEPDSVYAFVENSTATPNGFAAVKLDGNQATLAYSDDISNLAHGSELTIKKITGSAFTWAMLLTKLPTYANRTAALADNRPVDSLYKVVVGAETLIAII